LQIFARPCEFYLLAAAVGAALKQRAAGGVEYLVVETSGLADPHSLIAALDAEYGPGLLTQGGGGRPAPLARRFHKIPTHFSLNLHGI
jgi:hypothetical protein